MPKWTPEGMQPTPAEIAAQSGVTMDDPYQTVGTSTEDPVWKWANQTFSPNWWQQQAAYNQSQGLRVPIDRLAAQSQPVMAQLAAGARREVARNPYDTRVADQSRAAQTALLYQMRNQMNGPSLAAMQGQRGMAQMGQQALMQGGRAGMLGAQQGAGGLAGDIGQARLGEVMRSQAGMGGVAGNLRGGDLRSADAQSQSQLQAQRLEDERARFAATRGAALSDAQRNAELEYLKLLQRLKQRNQADATQTAQSNTQAGATLLDAIF